MANAVEELVICNDTPKVPDQEDFLRWQWLRHFRDADSGEDPQTTLAGLGNLLGTRILMYKIHRAIGVRGWRHCKTCDGISPWHAYDGLDRAGREQQKLQESGRDVNLLVDAIRRFPNLKTIIIDNTNIKSGQGRLALIESGWANVTDRLSPVHSLAVLFKALEVVGPTSVEVKTSEYKRPKPSQSAVPLPISLSNLLSEVSIPTISSAVGNVRSLSLGALRLTQEESQVQALLPEMLLVEPSSNAPAAVLAEIINSATSFKTLFLGCTSKHAEERDQNPGHIHLPMSGSMATFPHLRSLNLVNFWFHETHLQAFLRACPSLVDLHLDDIELLPGNWYTLLNGLKGAHRRLSKLELVSHKRVAHDAPDVDATARMNVLKALRSWLRGSLAIIPIEPDFELPRRPQR
ncbi:MAG: hypothetical protein Q9191_007637 [Dirinaria sp. TL-2023a]